MSIILLAEVGKLKKDIGTYVRKDDAQRAFVFTLGVDSGALLEDWLQDAGNLSAFQTMCESITLMREVSYYPTAMDAVAASNTAMDTVVASQVAMDVVAASQIAMDAVAASQTAMDAVVASQTAMDAVVASQTAMDAVAASQTAMDAVAASQTAMDAVVASQTAMDAVAASQTAMDAVFNSSIAKLVMWDSPVSEKAFRDNEDALSYLDSNFAQTFQTTISDETTYQVHTTQKCFCFSYEQSYTAASGDRSARYFRHFQDGIAGDTLTVPNNGSATWPALVGRMMDGAEFYPRSNFSSNYIVTTRLIIME